MGKNAKLKEKQKWSNEKLHLDNSRKLRGIYFIDPEDKEFKETIKNARKKLETPMAPAIPCKIIKNNKNCGNGASMQRVFFHQLDVLSQRRCVDESAQDQQTGTVLDDKRLKANTCADCCNLTEH